MERKLVLDARLDRLPLRAMDVWSVNAMQRETKFLRLRRPATIGSRFGDWTGADCFLPDEPGFCGSRRIYHEPNALRTMCCERSALAATIRTRCWMKSAGGARRDFPGTS
jgi:hypothetical protein